MGGAKNTIPIRNPNKLNKPIYQSCLKRHRAQQRTQVFAASARSASSYLNDWETSSYRWIGQWGFRRLYWKTARAVSRTKFLPCFFLFFEIGSFSEVQTRLALNRQQAVFPSQPLQCSEYKALHRNQ